MRWGRQGLDTCGGGPPGFGIVHQVKLEYRASGVHRRADGVAFPDTCVGTDSHTTMINGMGVVGWGVGGIEGWIDIGQRIELQLAELGRVRGRHSALNPLTDTEPSF